jgi:hypothetical protein
VKLFGAERGGQGPLAQAERRAWETAFFYRGVGNGLGVAHGVHLRVRR